MSAISGTQRLLHASTVKVAVMCVLFGLWGFVPLVGADIPRTSHGQGALAIAGTITHPRDGARQRCRSISRPCFCDGCHSAC